MVAKINDRHARRLKSCGMTLFQALDTHDVYIVDFNGKKIDTAWKVLFDDIPSNWLPDPSVYVDGRAPNVKTTGREAEYEKIGREFATAKGISPKLQLPSGTWWLWSLGDLPEWSCIGDRTGNTDVECYINLGRMVAKVRLEAMI